MRSRACKVAVLVCSECYRKTIHEPKNRNPHSTSSGIRLETGQTYHVIQNEISNVPAWLVFLFALVVTGAAIGKDLNCSPLNLGFRQEMAQSYSVKPASQIIGGSLYSLERYTFASRVGIFSLSRRA